MANIRGFQLLGKPVDVLLVSPLTECYSRVFFNEAPWDDYVREFAIRERLTPRAAVSHIRFAQL